MVAIAAPLAAAQTAPPKIKKLYVAPFPDRPGAATLRATVLDKLTATPSLQLVADPKDADALVDGNGETWIKGYVSLSTRDPGSARQPVYGGYLSLSVKDTHGQTLWSYMVTPGRLHWNGVEQDMAEHIVRLMAAALAHGTAANPPQPATSAAQISIAGAGSTFSAPLYKEWIQAFEELHPELHFTYQGVGSEEGIRLVSERSVDFAGSDAFLTDEQMAVTHVHFDHYATVLGGVVPAYNLAEGARDLRFTPEVLAAIYLGKINRWNDPALRAINHGATLPDQPIAVIHRADGSGTTFAWTDFLSKTSPDWKSAVGSGLKVVWPTGTAAPGNEGVAAAIANTPGALGYVELTYAVRHRLNFGLVRNAASRYVQANLESLNAAAAGPASAATDFRRSLVNPPGKGAYPITTFTWILLPQDASPKKTAALHQLVRWMLTAGQKECSGLGYVPLPRELAERELATLATAAH
jgi:phosphate ABC transporter phosphate-binding protein